MLLLLRAAAAPAIAGPAIAAAAVLATLLAAVAAPLAVYTTTLAVFGVAHVLAELRYVDARFGERLGAGLRWRLGALLVGVVALRLSGVFEALPYAVRTNGELVLVALLAASVLPEVGRVALPVVAAIGVGIAISPIHTLLALAVLHNATPIGFVLEAVAPERRRAAGALCAALFVGLPLLIASGAPHALLAPWGLVSPDAALLPVGPLAKHLGVYLPAELHDTPWALHAFSGAVFAQCMHYAAVLHVLPRLLPERARGTVAWPAGAAGVAGLTLAGAAFLALFAWDFAQARVIYGVAAAVHAWLEVPVLLFAFAPATARAAA